MLLLRLYDFNFKNLTFLRYGYQLRVSYDTMYMFYSGALSSLWLIVSHNFQTYTLYPSLFHYNRHHFPSNWPHTSPSQIFRSDGLRAFKCRRKMTRFLGWFLLVWNIISCPSWFHSFDFVRKSIGEKSIYDMSIYIYICVCVSLYIYIL